MNTKKSWHWTHLIAAVLVVTVIVCWSIVPARAFSDGSFDGSAGDSEASKAEGVGESEENLQTEAGDLSETGVSLSHTEQFIERLRILNADLVAHAEREIASLTEAEREQLVSAWRCNLFDRVAPEEAPVMFCNDSSLSQETSLVLVMTMTDDIMQYIVENTSGDFYYLEQLSCRYEELLGDLEQLCIEGQNNFEKISKKFKEGFMRLVELNFQEQEVTESPTILQSGMEYFEETNADTVRDLLSYMAANAG